LLQIMVDSVQDVSVDGLTVIDGQSDLPAARAASFLEQFKQAAGVDVGGLVRTLAASKGTSATIATEALTPPDDG
jgi:flotillin